MKIYFSLLLLGLLVTSAWCKKRSSKVKKEKDQLDLIAEDEAADAPKQDAVVGGYEEDPCFNFKCGAGRVCEVNDDKEPKCMCIKGCLPELDIRRRVCSNHNETWDSDCQLYQMRCWCDEGSDECKDNKYKHVHVDYYGTCKEIPDCKEEEKEDFPRRMREWLFNIMQDLANRKELQEPYLQLEQEAEEDLTKKWANAVIWKFCDLDNHPHDRSVSRHELFPIRAPLLAMEHCIAPFLDGCDADDDHKITLKEWGVCLGIEEGEIEDKCADIRDAA